MNIKKRPARQSVVSFKTGNLFGEVPLDVAYAGCSHLDCLSGCDAMRGHCQRLENAFIAAGYDKAST